MKCTFLALMFVFVGFQQLYSKSKIQPVYTVPSYVWIDQIGEGRNVYAYFRNEFELTSVPKTASMKLYAKSLYNLFVNGVFVNFGPIRSYETHPYFDSIDIAPYLKAGKNIVAVKVQSNGINTYQVPYGTAGFIAWGTIENSGKLQSLSTPGNWICRKAQGYNQLSSRFSFAQGPTEIFDAQLEPDEWQTENIQTKWWSVPVLLKNQNYFGKLTARTFPLLTNTEVNPKFSVNRLNLSSNEKFYNWTSQYENPTEKRDNKGILVYSYIFSPEEKDVFMGFSWGKYWINGELIKTTGQPEKAFRSNATVHLKKGWNSFFAAQEIVWNNQDGMLALPENTDIQFSVNKKQNDLQRFALTDPVERDVLKSLTINNLCPEKPETLKYKWNRVTGVQPYINTAKEIAWLDKQKVNVDQYKTTDLKIQPNENQAMVYDFGSIQLGRIFLDVDAPAGTCIDLTWSEDLLDSLVTLYKRMEINAIAHFTTKSGKQHLETFRPYGLRYLQVTVRNNSQPVTIQKAGINRQVYPYDKKGSFACSDPLMNDIWEMGWRTIQVCSEDSYTDTPFRERGHYAGDFFPEFATTLASSGDPRLAKQTVRLFNQKYEKQYRELEDADLHDFPLINIMVASWYIRQFNDVAFANEVYPIYSKFLEKTYNTRKPDELYHQKKAFIEWLEIDKSADLTTVQSLMCGVYKELSGMAKMLDKSNDAKQFGKWADEAKQLVQTKCWDATAGNFIDGIKNGSVLPTRFPCSSTWPSIWNITTSEQEKSIQNWFKESLINIGPPINRKQLSTPYGGFYALASLYQYGNAIVAEEYIRKNWGKMVTEANDLTWEDFNRDEKSTMSHAWASSPTYYLSTQVLGVDLGFPGNLSPDTIYIRPQSESISWAKGTVPHPKGLVSVDWKIIGNRLILSCLSPKGVPVVVEPRGRLAAYQIVVTN